MSCGVCGKVRARLPQALQAPLAALERRMATPKGGAALAAAATPRREDDEGDEGEDEVKRP